MDSGPDGVFRLAKDGATNGVISVNSGASTSAVATTAIAKPAQFDFGR